jgi:soluble lytic murein transglycosylase-like protein
MQHRTMMVAVTAGLALALLTGARPVAADWVADEIYAAAARYGVSGDYLVGVAECESGLDPYAMGVHGEIGVLQFMPDTFYAYGGNDIWSVADQADVAARMFSEGLSYHWLCA